MNAFRLLPLAACAALLLGAAPRPRSAPRVIEITSRAQLVLPGVVSSEYSEIRLATSPDGRTVIWGSTNRPGGPGGWNLWLSRRGARGWSAPAPVPFNSDSNDFDPAFSPDGRHVYFFSNRAGGLGGDDLWRAPVRGDSFGVAENLGAGVNSTGDEWAPTPSADGAHLLFATNGRGGQGRHDLFVASLVRGRWQEPLPLPGLVNTDADEFDATWLHDGSTLVYSRSADVTREPIALYCATRAATGYGAGVRLSDSVNVTEGYTLGPSVARSHPGVLYFSAFRAQPSAGRMDVYQVRYR